MPESTTHFLARYVVVMRPRQEPVAQEHLIKLGNSTLLLIWHSNQRRRGKLQQVTKRAFPGYVFVGLKPGSHAMAPISSTQN